MKSYKYSQFSALLAAGLAVSAPASAQFVTSFENAQGYTTATLNGLDDPTLAGTAAWYVPGGLSGGGSVQTYLGAQALRLSDSSSAGWATALNVSSAINYSESFNLSFNFAVASVNPGTATGTAPVINFRLGADTNSNSNKSWLRLSYNADGSLSLWTNSGGTTTTQTAVGSYASFASAGTYLSVSIGVNPLNHTYTGLTFSGDLGSQTVTSISGMTLPWIPNTSGEPPSIFWAHTTGAPTSISYIDNISLTNIPEPSTYAALLGLTGLGAAAARRRRRA